MLARCDPAGPESFLLADLTAASQGSAPPWPPQATLKISAKNWIYWPSLHGKYQQRTEYIDPTRADYVDNRHFRKRIDYYLLLYRNCGCKSETEVTKRKCQKSSLIFKENPPKVYVLQTVWKHSFAPNSNTEGIPNPDHSLSSLPELQSNDTF